MTNNEYLLRRLEAGEISRDLDAAIAVELGLVPQNYVRSTSYLYAHEPHYFLRWDASRPYTFDMKDAPWLPPDLTTSLDAVATVMNNRLPGWGKELGDNCATIIDQQGYRYTALGGTMAAAWMAAILRALQS